MPNIMIILFLLIATFADYIDMDCSNEANACVSVNPQDRDICDECKKGCTPTTSSQQRYGRYEGQRCRAFYCRWNELLEEPNYQGYDARCNFDELKEWAPLMEVDEQCHAEPKICHDITTMTWETGGQIAGLSLYRQKDIDDCKEPKCPNYDWVPLGMTCNLECRMDGNRATQRTCSISDETLEICKRSCNEGNVDCPNFSCSALKGTWKGEFAGGKWDVCWNYDRCGQIGGAYDNCCRSAGLGVGQGERDSVTGKEAGCFSENCQCETGFRGGMTRASCCGASELTLLFAIIAAFFSIF